MDGILNVLKPIGMSSYQVIERVKKITGQKKVGHTGTLDPGAAGVLPLCLGRATKIAGIISDLKKEYRAEITFGLVTDTQDSFGKILESKDVHISKDEIQQLLEEFTGTISQVPPMYSAVKQGGKRLYQLARKGIQVERKPRQVTVYSLKLVDYFSPNRALIDIACSKGTYIRTLCHDIGARSGLGAIMSFLVRLRSGHFILQDTVTIEELENAAEKGNLSDYLLPINFPLQHLEKIEISDRALRYAINGNPLYYHNLISPPARLEEGQLLRIYHGGRLIALGRFRKDRERPCINIERVFYQVK